MSAPAWSELEALFHEALARPVAERVALLAERCAGRPELRVQVEAMLRAQDEARGGLDVSGMTTHARLAHGTRLGAYEIAGPLGAGGMGEVYRARDTKLRRDVAIKILPSAFVADADRAARFEREARVLAALNHPNIAHVYGLEQASGLQALVMELVEGPTLADRIAQGAIPVDEALPIAKQIAEALEAAHEQGIIHRDLKPANIKLRPDGVVKVLDFGLAKALEPVSAAIVNVTASPTITSPAMMTGVGMLLGTAAYMSPEQARGKAVDKRADIWAFGAVLYEMLTGTRAFPGADVTDILATVLKSEPDWAALPADVPASIRTLIKRCLEKDRTRRVTDIGAALFVIDEQASLAPGAAAALPLRRPPLWKRAVTAAAAVVVGAGIASGAWWSIGSSVPPLTITRFPLTLPEGQRHGALAISPDGTQMVYRADNQLYLRSMSELEARPIQGAETVQNSMADLVFSPDGQSIAFWGADRTLKRIAVSGGAAVTICPADSLVGISWGKDGIVFGQSGRGITRVSASGGTPEVLVSVKDNELAHGPQMLPDGQTVLFTLATGLSAPAWDKAHIVVQSLRSGERKTLIEGGSDARYVPTGHLVYALGGTLFAVPFDLRRLEITGGPVPMVEGVRRGITLSGGAAEFSVSDTGSLVYILGPTATSNALRAFVLADRAGDTEPLNLPPGAYVHPRVSPDGTRLAFGTDDGNEANVWIYELSGASAPRRITFSGKNRFPVWSGDGQRVAFQSDRDGDLGLFWQRADGAGAPERLTKGEQGASHVPESWSRDGKHVLFTVAQGSTFTLWTYALDDRKATPLGDVRSDRLIGAVFSPDGRWVAYASAGPNGNGGYVQPFPATGARYQIPHLYADYHPLWASDGKELFYIPAYGRFAAVSVQTQPSVTFGNPVEMTMVTFTRSHFSTDVRSYDLTPSGKFVALVDPQEQSGSGPSAAPEIRVVLNWFEELKRRVPVP